MTILSLSPSEIRYSQDSIAYYFGYGRYSGTQIGQTVDDLLQRKCYVDDIPRITVTSRNGLWYSGDNRRLWVFRTCEELGFIDRVPAMEGYVSSSKFTTYNAGVSIRVRGNPGGRIWTQRHRKELVIKEPEPSNPVVPNVPVVNSTLRNESVVISLVEDEELHHGLSDSSEDLTDIPSDCGQSGVLESSVIKHCSEETESCHESMSSNLEDGMPIGQDNHGFDSDEDGQHHVDGTKDLASTYGVRFRSTQDEIVLPDNIYVSVDMSTMDECPLSSDQPASVDVETNNSTLTDTNHSTVSMPGESVDVESGPKVRASRLTFENIRVVLSKYRYTMVVCLILVAIVILVLIVVFNT
ncbi:uncharacterized protein LOC117336492 [Pecten maximus]|uniref:uncharacterized protein LOC117336492 n=1 Tax=Pecten maximus TaxID=6579 RepID=UPI0014591B84|nr:uncharacterized protein LOC117336492 [Pecten maximus]